MRARTQAQKLTVAEASRRELQRINFNSSHLRETVLWSRATARTIPTQPISAPGRQYRPADDIRASEVAPKARYELSQGIDNLGRRHGHERALDIIPRPQERASLYPR